MQIVRRVNTNDIVRYVCKIARQLEYRNLLVRIWFLCVLLQAIQEKRFTNLQLPNAFDFNRIKVLLNSYRLFFHFHSKNRNNDGKKLKLKFGEGHLSEKNQHGEGKINIEMRTNLLRTSP